MPDTGAPWYIPYVAGTDLVSDWPTDSQDLAEAVADALDDAAVAGIGTNVVQTVKTDSFTTTSISFTGITGLTATITPSSATAKVLIIAQITYSLANAIGHGAFKLSGGNTAGYIGNAIGSNRVRATFGGYGSSNNALILDTGLIVYLDSPATTSATTYGVDVRQTLAGFVTVNIPSDNTLDNAARVLGASSITAIEVAA